jgi:hypothetical protein
MVEMNHEALRQLIRVMRWAEAKMPTADELYDRDLDASKETHFNLAMWGRSQYKGSGESLEAAADCGFAGCACGWAGMDTWFHEQGFYYSVFEGMPTFITNDLVHSSWAAVNEFFGLSHEQSSFVFYDGYYVAPDGTPSVNASVTPAQVISHAQWLLDGHDYKEHVDYKKLHELDTDECGYSVCEP